MLYAFPRLISCAGGVTERSLLLLFKKLCFLVWVVGVLECCLLVFFGFDLMSITCSGDTETFSFELYKLYSNCTIRLLILIKMSAAVNPLFYSLEGVGCVGSVGGSIFGCRGWGTLTVRNLLLEDFILNLILIQFSHLLFCSDEGYVCFIACLT